MPGFASTTPALIQRIVDLAVERYSTTTGSSAEPAQPAETPPLTEDREAPAAVHS